MAETLNAGDALLASTGDSVTVERVVLHPGWLENGRPEDIALIRVTQPVSEVPLVALYIDRDEHRKEVIITGNGDFGTGRTGPQGNDGTMRAATNRIDGVRADDLSWQFDDPRTHPERTTKLEGINGPGDSGGPAFIHGNGEDLLAGLSSGQSTDATHGRKAGMG